MKYFISLFLLCVLAFHCNAQTWVRVSMGDLEGQLNAATYVLDFQTTDGVLGITDTTGRYYEGEAFTKIFDASDTKIVESKGYPTRNLYSLTLTDTAANIHAVSKTVTAFSPIRMTLDYTLWGQKVFISDYVTGISFNLDIGKSAETHYLKLRGYEMPELWCGGIIDDGVIKSYGSQQLGYWYVKRLTEWTYLIENRYPPDALSWAYNFGINKEVN